MLKNETNGMLNKYEWREGNILLCRDHKGEVFRFFRNYETLTSTSRKALFVKENDLDGTVYERKIKKLKVGTREVFTNKVSLSLSSAEYCYECSELAKDRETKELQSLPDCPNCYNSECPKYHAELNRIYKQFKSSKKKHYYEVIGYRFTPFPPKARMTKSKIDEKPFIERLSHASYRNMLLADIKLLLQLQGGSTIELCKFLAIVIKCYRENLDNEQEVKTFQKIIEKLIRTAKTPIGKHYFRIFEDEFAINISQN